MPKKRLLCITPGSHHTLADSCRRWPDWEVSVAQTPRDAARLLRTQRFLVGLLIEPCHDGAYDEMEQFLSQQTGTQWVGVFDGDMLKHPRCRQLVADHLFDFHTLPVDEEKLSHTLGHTHGCAALRQNAHVPGVAHNDMGITGAGAAVATLRRQIVKVAGADAPVLIWGESGSGKELAARAIHASSPRAGQAFVPINCGAIPANLIQSELFGHVRGAFSGATADKVGLIESAARGTLFLDEIGDLQMDLQANLLRFLQEKTIYRVGSTQPTTVDVRIIAASHINLQHAVAKGAFREDLYYRLNVLTLEVPPLRERKDDMALLANHFFEVYAAERAPHVRGFSRKAVEAMRLHDWPGNVRELLNRVRRAIVMAEGRLITPHDLGLAEHAAAADGDALGSARLRAERDTIMAILQKTGRNLSQAARDLGISRMTLYRLLAKHKIEQ
ncbi:MAG TPA: sigma 54-interacting transcriptional regulator [Burkholderiaceae bacterium]